jgi:magnesium transporter
MLVNCVAYQNGRKLADLPIEDVSEYVSRPDCFVWVGLFEPDPAELALLAEEFDLHELAVDDAQGSSHRPKIVEHGDSLFAVVHTLDRHPTEPQADWIVGEVLIFVGRNYLLTVRRRSLQGFTVVRERCEREPEHLTLGPGYVLYALLDEVVDRYFPLLDDLEGALEKLEAQIFRTTPTKANIESFYDLKYRLTVLKHAVAPLMEAVGKLFGGRVPPVVANAQDYFRDVYDHLARVNAAIENLREMLQTAISVSLTLISLAESEVTKRLAAWGALITIPTLIAGIYGMNFQHMPELDWQVGYPLAVGFMAVVDVVLYQRFRKAGWL